MEAGGKGAFWGELIRNGVIAPPGFVILTQTFDRFLNAHDLNTRINESFVTLNRGEGSIEAISNSYTLNEKEKSYPIQVAVVIQVMINPEISGITFSVNPVNENFDEMIIEAAFGLGEAIVQGEITPDHYCINKSSFTLIDIITSIQERAYIS